MLHLINHVKAITTDLHIAYRKPIQDLGFKHQFCEFHTKQNINKYLYNHVKENNIKKETHKEYKKNIWKKFIKFTK